MRDDSLEKSRTEEASILKMAYVVIRDMDNRITAWNSGAERLYGFTEAEALGKVSYDLFQTQFPVSREAVNAALHEVGEWEGELIRTRRDGTRIVVTTHMMVHRNDEGEAVSILEVNTDITALKQTKAALKRSEERFQKLVATTPGAILTFQLRPDGSTCFPYASPGVEQIFGLWPEELLEDGAMAFALIHPDDLEMVRAAMAESARTMLPEHCEFRIQNPVRGEIWVEGRNAPVLESDGSILWYGFINEITERKQREEEIRKSQHRLKMALDAATIGLWDWNLQTGEVVWEGHHDTLFGFMLGEFDGTYDRFFAMIHPEDRAGLEAALQHARDTQSPYRYIYRAVRPDGNIHWMTASGQYSYNDAGEAIRMAGAIMDISAYKENEQEILHLQETAKQQEQLLGVAHHTALDILASQTGKEALEHLVETARLLVNARYGALGVTGAETKDLQEFITVGMTPEEERRIGNRPMGRGLLGLLLQCDKPMRLENLKDHPAARGFPAHHPPMTSFLGVPIRLGGIVLGSLYLTDKAGGGAFTEADVQAVYALSAHVAVAIRNLHMVQRQRALVKNLITIQEEERRAIAYDLHDGLTQYVMASHAFLESCQEAQDSGNTEYARTMLESGMLYLKEAVIESRRLVNGLRALALEDLGLAGALEQLLQEEKARAGWEHIEFAHNIAGQHFDLSLETTLYRIAQEALNNARKHSGTSRVQVQLLLDSEHHTGDGELTLKVRDWGCGFEPSTIRASPSHVGLHGINERVRLLDGHLEINSSSGHGTVISTTFPVLFHDWFAKSDK